MIVCRFPVRLISVVRAIMFVVLALVHSEAILRFMNYSTDYFAP